MKRIYYILMLSSSLLLVSCNRNESDLVIDTNSGAYRFSLEPQTGNLSSVWSVDDTIGITAYLSDSHNIYSNYINVKYRFNSNNSFVPATEGSEILHPVADQLIDLIAYYPYRANALTSFPFSLNEQSNQKQIDLLYSNNARNKTNTSRNIEFVFSHVLSKIIIHTVPSGGFKAEDLYGINTTIDNVYGEGILRLTDGHVEASSEKSSIEMRTSADGTLSEAIVLPGPASDIGLTLRLANGRVYSADFPKEQLYKSGHTYSYIVTITHTSIFFDTIEIEDWVTDNIIPDEGIADEIVYKIGDFYPNPNNPKTAIGIVYWTKPGTGGKEGKIVSHDSALKNWGDSDNINLNTTISTGIRNWDIVKEYDSTLENFPAFKWCEDKGEGWYLPSRYELHTLQELWLTHNEFINSNLELIEGEPFTLSDEYLASSESRSWPEDKAEVYSFSSKGWDPLEKSAPGRIRAVKEF